MKIKHLIITILFAFGLIGCEKEQIQVINPIIPEAGYPYNPSQNPSIGTTYPYPNMSGNDDQQIVIMPTKDSKLGTVKGKLVFRTDWNGHYILHLAPIVQDNDGNDLIVQFDRSVTIVTEPDANDEFVFVNVPFGRYGLVFDTISTAYLITNSTDSTTLIIAVESNETIDLGKVNFSFPTGP